MKKLLLTILLTVSLAGCNMLSTKGEDKTGEKKEGTTTEEKKDTTTAAIAVGDTVVAKWSTSSFYEGKVESIDSVKAKVKWNDNSNPSDVDLVDVYAMPKPGTKPDVKAGDMVLAKTSTGSYWNGAEITNIDGDVYVVKTTQGTSANVPPEKIIKVSAATMADMKKQAGSTDFLKEAQAKSPTIPVGYKPKAGDRVVAEWVSKSWYTGTVQSVAGGKATIAWEDKSKPSEVIFERVIPMPNAGNQPKPEANDYVVVKPTAGTRWDYMQVVTVNGSSYEVKNASGQTRSIKAGEYIVLK